MSVNTIEKPEAGTELITVPEDGTEALRLFVEPRAMDPHLAKIRAVIDGFTPDLSTASSRDRIKSLAYRVARSKTYLDGIGKRLYQEQVEIPKRISLTRKAVELTLDRWRDEVRQPLTDWETKEKDRVDRHQVEIGRIARMGNGEGKTAEALNHDIANLESIEIGPACEEFAIEYADARVRALSSLRSMLTLRAQYEAEQAELQQLRAEAEARKIEDEKKARIAAEKAKLDALKSAIEEAERTAEADAVEATATITKTTPVDPKNAIRAAAVRALVLNGVGLVTAETVVKLVDAGKIPSLAIRY